MNNKYIKISMMLFILVISISNTNAINYYGDSINITGYFNGKMNVSSPNNYEIYKLGDIIYAKNGMTNLIDYTGTDFSTILQSIVNCSNGLTGSIHIRSGTYMMNSTVKLTYYLPLHIYGDAVGYSTIIQDNTTGDLFLLESNSNIISNLHIIVVKDKIISENGSTIFNITGSSEQLKDIYINMGGLGNIALAVRNPSWNPTIENIVVGNFKQNSIGFFMDVLASGGIYKNLNFVGDPANYNGTGFLIKEGNGMFFDFIQTYGLNRGIVLSPSTGKTIAQPFFSQAIADTSYLDNWVFEGEGVIQNMVCVDCWGSVSATGSSFNISNGRGITFVAPRGIYAGKYGFEIKGGASRGEIIIDNPQITVNNRLNQNYSGVLISRNNVTISGGFIGEGNNYGGAYGDYLVGYQKYGVDFGSSVSTGWENIILNGVRIEGNIINNINMSTNNNVNYSSSKIVNIPKFEDIGLPARTINYIIDGGGLTPETGNQTGDIEISNSCIIKSVRLKGDQTGNLNITISKTQYGSSQFTEVGTIAIINNMWSEDTTLSGWTTLLNEGDWLRFKINSVETLTSATASITCKR